MIYQFSSISLNTDNMQLHINGKPVEAEDRLLYLLAELITHYPQHCDKDDLLDKLWPDTVVSEWSISKLVSDTRHLFKLHQLDQEVIQTVRGKGYRLNPVLGEQLRISDKVEIFRQSINGSAKIRRGWLIGACASVLVILATWWVFFEPGARSLVVSEPSHSVGRLLWVDDNPSNNSVERQYLEQHNITVYQVKSTEAALTSLTLYEYSAIISDMGRDGEVLAGLNLLKSMRSKNNRTPFFLYTIVLTDAQQQLMEQHDGQGVAVNPEQLYQLILPLYPQNAK